MRSTKKIFVALAAAGIVAASGSALTADNTLNGENFAGYATDVVSGATTTGIEHTLSTDGSTIRSTLLTFTTNLTTEHTVKAAFGTAALENCTVNISADTANCAYADPYYVTADADSFVVAVS